MSVADIAAHLRCPVCSEDVTAEPRRLVCVNGHSFDIAKQGHINLLNASQPRNADSADMVAARLRWLETGAYDPILDLVADMAGEGPGPLLDVGAGPGWYAAGLAARLHRPVIAADVSVPACRTAARLHPELGVVVADTWKGLPVRSGAIRTLVCIFAPRSPFEFARVLEPGGQLIVVTPLPEHLARLRETAGLLGIDPDKDRRLADLAERGFTLVAEREHRATVTAEPARVADLIAMGPNAFHDHGDLTEAGDDLVPVEVAVKVTSWRRD